MRKKIIDQLIFPGLLATCFIVFTVIISQNDNSRNSFDYFCFLFNAIPSDVGFLPGGEWIFFVYYLFLFVLLTLFFGWTKHLIKLLANKYYITRLK